MNHWKQSRSEYRQFLAEGNLKAARDRLKIAISEIPQLESYEIAGMYNQLAKINLQLNEPIAAELSARHAINAEMQFGPALAESDRMAAHYVMLADALSKQRKISEALTTINKGIELYGQHIQDGDELMVNLMNFRKAIADDKWRESS